MSGEVRLVRSIRASQAELWRACSTASGLEAWYADRVTGSIALGSTVTLAWPDLGVAIDVEITELVLQERIVFRRDQSQVTLEIENGLIRLAHTGLDEHEDLEGLASSWRVALVLLCHTLEVHAGVVRRTRWVSRTAVVSPTVAHLWFTEPKALETWFGRDVVFGAEGEPYSLSLGSRDQMSGRVLAETGGRDVVLSWHERHDSVLVFRTLPARNGERLLALCWSIWGPTEPGEQAIETELKRSLERLVAILSSRGQA